MKQTLYAVKSINTLIQEVIEPYLAEIKALTTIIQPTQIAEYVPQHYVGYIDCYSKNTIISTIGLGPCVGIGIYNKKLGKVALAHIDDSTTQDSVLGIFKNMRSSDEEPLDLYLIGGNKASFNYLSSIIIDIKKLTNVTIVHQDLFPKNKSLENPQKIAIDISGSFYTNFPEEQIKFNTFIHPFKSPLIKEIFNSCKGNYEFPLSLIDFNDESTIIGELEGFFTPY